MKTISHNWWILAAQGFFLTAVGALAVLNADVDLYDIIQYLGLILLGFGVILGLLGLRAKSKGKNWGFVFSSGVLQLALGLLILANPSSSSFIFTLIIGVWALLMAGIQIVLAAINKNGRILYLINALISGIFGALIIWYNFDDQRSLTTLVGIYCLILGITIVYYSIRLRMGFREKKAITEETGGTAVNEAPSGHQD